MRIREIRVIVAAPGRNLTTVKILTDEPELYGVGDATLNGRELAVVTLIEQHIAPMLIGRDPGAIEDLWQVMYKGAYWRGGPIQTKAISAIDMALWDIKGKLCGQPVYSLLGGKARRGCTCYTHAHGRDFQETEESVRRFVERGYKVVRAQVSVPGLTGTYGAENTADETYRRAREAQLPFEGTFDVEPYLQIVPRLFEHLRSTIGWGTALFHDAHGRLTPNEAARLAQELEPYRLLFLEDPIGPEHTPSMRLVRQASTTPLGIGEIINSVYNVLPLVTEQLIDYMRCGPPHIGGITAAKKTAALAEPFQVKTAYHGPGDISPVGNAASVHVGLSIPNFGVQEWTGYNEQVYEVFQGGPRFEDGLLVVDDTPGLGVDIDEEAAKKYPYRRSYLPIPRRSDGSVIGY